MWEISCGPLKPSRVIKAVLMAPFFVMKNREVGDGVKKVLISLGNEGLNLSGEGSVDLVGKLGAVK